MQIMNVLKVVLKNSRNIIKLRSNYIIPVLSITSFQLRGAHTDIKVPDFTKYMRKSCQDPTTIASKTDSERKLLPNLVAATLFTIGLYATKAEIIRDVMFMGASADVLALAKIEVNLKEIPEGVSATYKWRGKPLFVRHRAPDDIAAARAVPIRSLRDPASDEERCQRPDWLVTIGICTHLGCVPLANAGDFGPGGYYCPCHGSHFDGAGRIRKGPAPLNLEIPEHKFVDDDTLVVG